MPASLSIGTSAQDALAAVARLHPCALVATA